ncbi:MAG: DUF2155 domain-containing protein [Pseudomonadota bacterium]
MIRRLSAATACLLASSVVAQETPDTSTGVGATVRALDTLNGTVEDIEMRSGSSRKFGKIEISLKECRFPTANPSQDAYAFLTVLDERQTDPSFEGWMLASSPALSSLEHQRYDVWVLACITE